LPRPVVAYDAGCGPCATFKAVAEFLDCKHEIRFVSLEQADEEGTLDSVDRALRYRSFHLVSSTGRVESGAEAILPLARAVLPAGRVFGALASFPGVRAALDFGYKALSRLHGKGVCGASLG